MIYYPLSNSYVGGDQKILIISTPQDLLVLKSFLGDGSKLGFPSLMLGNQAQMDWLKPLSLEDFIGDVTLPCSWR